MTSLTQKFVKTYEAQNDGKFKYTTMVSHKGTVIAFAMDDRRRIYYTVLDMERSDVESPIDVEYWNLEPTELVFPQEIASVGYSAAGTRQMPSVILAGTEGLGEEIDTFLSSTACLSADAPFQVLSDNKHIYVFRQADTRKPASQEEHFFDSNGKSLELMQETLLLDRFVYVGGQLQNKLEVRYQRSRQKDLPASRKDALGYEDLEKNEFYEPTQQLSFIRNLHEGRFSALLIPTALPDVQRWQIFAYNAKTERMDSFNIERSADGLFNTRGTRYYTSPDPAHQNDVFERNPGTCPFTNEPLVPIVSKDGYAESALALNGVDESVQIDLTNGEQFPLLAPQPAESTLEVWVKLDAAEPNQLQTLMACGEYSIQYVADSQEFKVSSPVDEVAFAVALADDQFHHLSLIFRAAGSALYLDGQLIEPKMRSAATGSPTGDSATRLYFGCDRQQTNYLKGVIDEVRIWNRVRSPQEMTDEMNHRLVGNEPGLIGYWRFDEGAGTTIYDQTDNARHGEFITPADEIAQRWVKSQAPVGEHPGVRRSSFSFEGRTITAGCAALLYHQQEKAVTGYNPDEEKPLKRNARVMFAVPTSPNSRIAVLDFAVNREGNLAQVPDSLQLEELENTSINDVLDILSEISRKEKELESKVQERLNKLKEMEKRPLCTAIARLYGTPRVPARWLIISNKEGIEENAGNGEELLRVENEPKLPTVEVKSNQEILPDIDKPAFLGGNPSINGITSRNFNSTQLQTEYNLFSGPNYVPYHIETNNNPQKERRPMFDRSYDIEEEFNLEESTVTWEQELAKFGADAICDGIFFRGSKCASTNGSKLVDLQEISAKFPGFPSNFLSTGKLDAVYRHEVENSQSYIFFKGHDFVKWTENEVVTWSIQAYYEHLFKKKELQNEEKSIFEGLEDWEHDLFLNLLAFRQEIQTLLLQEVDTLDEMISDLKEQIKAIRSKLGPEQISQAEEFVRESPLTNMPFLLADPSGLTVSGGILGFASSDHTPCLFETTNGRISLYFKGKETEQEGAKQQENYFLAAYYDVLVERASYTLPIIPETTSTQNDEDETPKVEFIARSTGSAFNECDILVAAEENSSTCTVTLHSPALELTETWEQVPRNSRYFAEVLNGVAQPTYVGKLTEVSMSNGIAELALEGRGRQSIAAGDVLIIGSSKTQVKVQTVLPEFRGAALVFDGQNDYIQLGNSTQESTTSASSLSSTFSGDFTVEAWVWIDSDALDRDLPVLGMRKRVTNQSLHLTIRKNGRPHLGFFNNDLTSETQLLPNRWHHIAWRYSVKDQEQTIFVNGELDKAEGNREPFSAEGDDELYIGLWSDEPRYFQGKIGEVRIWSEARTLADIQTSMANGITGKERKLPTLVGCWRFTQELEQQAGQKPMKKIVAKDYSSQSRHGVIQGQPQLYQVTTKATYVEIENPTSTLEIGDSVYRLVYDYEARAHTNKVTRSLKQGSLLFSVVPSPSGGNITTGKAKQYKSAASGKWFTDTYGTALNFEAPSEGESFMQVQYADNDQSKLKKFSAEADLTLEAWVNHVAFPGGITRLIHHSLGSNQLDSLSTGYTMGLGYQVGEEGASLFVGVNDKFVQTKPILKPTEWYHLAASFNQSYGLEFEDDRDQVNCGNEITLDLAQDLTIEATINIANLSQPRGILTKGKMNDDEQASTYALYVDENGFLVLTFEDKESRNVFLSSKAGFIEKGKTYRIGVTRRKRVVTHDSGEVEEWYEIYFFKKEHGKEHEYVPARKYVPGNVPDIGNKYTGTIGSGNGPLTIGKAYSLSSQGIEACHFRGEISEVRLWNTALPEQELGKPIKGRENGLVAWWQFEENEGFVALDAKGQSHGTIIGAKWVKSTDPEASRIRIYVNGNSVPTIPWPTEKMPVPKYGDQPQFQLGMSSELSQKGDNGEHPFLGELDEVRIWRVARTEEQIQDNLFRRLIGDYQHLIAYYRFDFDAEQADSIRKSSGTIENRSGQGMDLTFSAPEDSEPFTIATAPISEEAAQVRSALAQAKSDFHIKSLASSPAVQEYGDMQYGIDGNLMGVMKRCYSYVEDGRWHLITGYKVGDLELEWIGQAQYDPQLIGFIEGAPPVPSENLTVRLPDLGQNYENVSVVDLTEAATATYSYSQSKEHGLDTALSFEIGAGFESETLAGVGIASSIEDTEISFGVGFSLETSNSWLNEKQQTVAQTTNKLSRLAVQGDWEDPNGIEYPEVGRRYLPKNVGFALVQSETADIFAMRLKHPEPAKRVTVALRMQPNPDIPKDWNIIIFPMNNRYCKQGTLDGRIGLKPEQKDYPTATDYSSDRSYFKPIEAYALKNRIEKEQKALEADYQSHSTSPAGARGLKAGAVAGALGAGIGSALMGGLASNRDVDLPDLTRRNMFNTYVWTADGGLFAETQQFMDVKQEVTAGEFSLAGMAGASTEISAAIAKVSFSLEMEALFGGHLNLSKTKSKESETSFGVEVDLDVERDILIATDEQAALVGRPMLDENGDRARCPGKVDGYRFMTFYLEPDKEHFKDFENKVVDRAWLEQSSDPNAAALRQVLEKQNGIPWRVLHRVTYVSRVLPEIGTPNAGGTTERLRAANIDSNWELIKRLEPYVKTKTSDYGEFKAAVEQAIERELPELKGSKNEIIRYMSLYFQIFEESDR